MDGNWVLAGVLAVFAIIAIVALLGIRDSLDNIEAELRYAREENRSALRTLGQIGNFLWPQHALAKRQLQRQDEAQKQVDAIKAKLKAEVTKRERPATAEQVSNLGSMVADLASSVDDLSEEIDDTSTIEEFRGTLAGLEAKMIRMEDLLATKDRTAPSKS